MSRLIFTATDVKRVVEHSLAAARQRPVAYTKITVKTPSVILVHDQGVYLMSNGNPRLPFVAYARGCDPKDDDWWETSRALVGGDDFAETLPWAAALKEIIDRGARQIVLNVSENSVSIVQR